MHSMKIVHFSVMPSRLGPMVSWLQVLHGPTVSIPAIAAGPGVSLDSALRKSIKKGLGSFLEGYIPNGTIQKDKTHANKRGLYITYSS